VQSDSPEATASSPPFKRSLEQIRQGLAGGAHDVRINVEHPGVAWDAQATTFTTGRFAEGRAR
jgi:hypothetical protein